VVVTSPTIRPLAPKIRHEFSEGKGPASFDLPGDRRAIRRIDFDYKSISRREGKGTVEVLAR
jgi:hypothetical protein